MEKTEYLKMMGWPDTKTICTAAEHQQLLAMGENVSNFAPIMDPHGTAAFGAGCFVVDIAIVNKVRAAAPPPPPAPAADAVTPPPPTNEVRETPVTTPPNPVLMARLANLKNKGWVDQPDLQQVVSPDGQIHSYDAIAGYANEVYTAFIKVSPTEQAEEIAPTPSATVEEVQDKLDEQPAPARDIEVVEAEEVTDPYDVIPSRFDDKLRERVIPFIDAGIKTTTIGVHFDEQHITTFEAIASMTNEVYGNLSKKYLQPDVWAAEQKAKETPAEEETVKEEVVEDHAATQAQKQLEEAPAPAPEPEEVVTDQALKEQNRSVAEAEWNDNGTVGTTKGFFTGLIGLGFQQLNLSVNRLSDDKFNVIVRPANFSGDKAYDELQPLVITGSADQLDAKFFEAIQPQMQQVAGLMTNAEVFIKNAEKKEKETKAAKERVEKVKKLVEAAKKYIDKDGYDISKKTTQSTTIKKWDAVLELDPTNKDAIDGKKVVADYLATNGDKLL